MSGPGQAADQTAELTVPYRARFDECGPDATIRASVLLRWAQDAAWIHSERLGFGREWYAERDLAWLVRGVALSVARPIAMGTTVAVTTRVVGFRRVMARRRTDVVLPDGSTAAVVTTDWVMTDARRGLPTRVPAAFPALFGRASEAFAPIRVEPGSPLATASVQTIRVRRAEIDPFGHANNAVSIDWVDEAIDEAFDEPIDHNPAGPDHPASSRIYRLEYLAPASSGAEIAISAWREGAGTWRVTIATTDGSAVTRALVERGVSRSPGR